MAPSFEKEIIQLRQLEALYGAVGAISSKLNLEDIFKSVPPAVKAITGSDEIFIALINKTTDGFEIDRETIRHTCPHPSHFLPKSNRQRCAHAVIETNKPFVVLSSGKLVCYDQLTDQSASNIVFTVVPLSSKSKCTGFLSVVAPKKRLLNGIGIILLTIFAGHTAIAIENARLHMRVQELNLAKERSRIVKEIREVVMKNAVCDEAILSASPVSIKEELTDKEQQILTLMAKGYTNKEIAKELFLGIKTVKTHVSNILKKLGQKNRVQAIVFALKIGLVELTAE